MKVLRERLIPREMCDPDEPLDPRDVTGRQPPCGQNGGGQRGKQMENVEDCLSKKIEAVVCNGNGIVGDLLKSEHKQILNSPLFYNEPQAVCGLRLQNNSFLFTSFLFVSMCFSLIRRTT